MPPGTLPVATGPIIAKRAAGRQVAVAIHHNLAVEVKFMKGSGWAAATCPPTHPGRRFLLNNVVISDVILIQ